MRKRQEELDDDLEDIESIQSIVFDNIEPDLDLICDFCEALYSTENFKLGDECQNESCQGELRLRIKSSS